MHAPAIWEQKYQRLYPPALPNTVPVVLSPPGLGYDTYRYWETLLLGAIPVVYYNQGAEEVLVMFQGLKCYWLSY